MKTALLPQLHVLLTVARLRSFSGAARELGVSTPAVSKAVRVLEEQLRVVLLNRTTRSVALTEAGRRLVEEAGPGLGQAVEALAHVAAQPGEAVGSLRLSAPPMAVPFVVGPLLSTFRERHPRVEVEMVIEQRFVDLVAEGYDAGVRLSEAIERDMVQLRLTDAFRFVVVGAPRYLERHGMPRKPEDLLRHECITFRSHTTGTLYAWELERGRRSWRVPVRGGVVTNDGSVMKYLAESGAGLTYAFEPEVREQLRSGTLVRVLEAYAPTVPGFFLYYPSRARRSGPLRLFVETARELAAKAR
ncbi:LysR family transcriptional regulator [Corallococcus sp. AB004]|uniref:LysR family transcriptional regulator n=1 Tax=Corallococcus sp. AB038B TaxID=2316718 RepID=UPI000EA0C423|nr:LysR family transcriptional regulator [Corallococcus sp. AB038B]RKI03815.1 LysR family transcriptional regulator [Corallococcus sp. AB038B]RKI49444.1 LysR family transcriptional regulator [Corallococcus sp. AB004]